MIETPALWLPSYAQGFARNRSEAANPNLWDGLVGLWQPTLGPTGLTLFDWSGFGNNGTLTNMDPATDWEMSQLGYALDFATADDQKVLINQLQFTTNWSISFWAWGNGGAGPLGNMVCGLEGDNDNFIYMSHVTRLRFENHAGANTEWIADTDFNGKWRHVALAADMTGVTLYLDGVLQGRNAIAPTFRLDSWGTGHTTAANDFAGKLSNMGLWNRVLTSNEIQLLYRDPHAIVRPKQRVLFASAAAPPAFAGSNLILGGGVL